MVSPGLSIVLGITIELALTLLVSSLFGTAIYTAMIMLSALFLRFFTGGAHCSSFNRGSPSWAAKSGSAFCLPLDLEYPYKALCSLTPERS
ncbi:MAG: accessory gene regulator B family protein [Dethiobacteria bacterium]